MLMFVCDEPRTPSGNFMPFFPLCLQALPCVQLCPVNLYWQPASLTLLTLI
uniref:Uncharacterized protein n=1 Tax=Arundo donax TaxID=35708 RepID=A0A0A9FZD2_ARUDO